MGGNHPGEGDDTPRRPEEDLEAVSDRGRDGRRRVTPRRRSVRGEIWRIRLTLPEDKQREREPTWSSPVGPYLGWIILGWVLTWAAVELHMLRRLRDTMSLTGEQWEVVIAFCSSLAGCRGVRGHPAVAQRKADARAGQEFKAGPAARPALNNARAAAT
jgi:hypothetical protein